MALAAIDDIKGRQPVALDVTTLTDVTDHMIVVSGSSGRHVRAIVDAVLEAAKARDAAPIGVEGRAPGDWVLIDLGDVVVHVMRETTRVFYDLEGLWEAHAPNDNRAAGLPKRDAGAPALAHNP